MDLSDFEIIKLDDFLAVKHIATLINKDVLAGKKKSDFFIDDCVTYPNPCAPLSGIIDYYKSRNHDVELHYIGDADSYLSNLNIENPYCADDDSNNYLLDYPFDKIWFFETPKGETKLVNSLMFALRKIDVLNDGVLSALEWCLNETMDNVLNHSQTKKGFVMAQYHQTNKLFSVCVFDYGIGIYNSFKTSKHHPKSKADAITLALQERVTRDDNVGQGNGLWGLHQIIEDNKGILRIISHGANYKMSFGEDEKNEPLLFEKGSALLYDSCFGTTLIDFQLSTSKSIDIGKALKGNELIDLWEENLENDNGDYVLNISTISQGTGTRPAAKEVRNIALNIALKENKKVILDFAGVNTISSSYADELVGKIIAEYGLLFFNKKFQIDNLNKFNTSIMERSVRQRMAQLYYDETIEDEQWKH